MNYCIGHHMPDRTTDEPDHLRLVGYQDDLQGGCKEVARLGSREIDSGQWAERSSPPHRSC